MNPNLKNVSGLGVCNFCGSGDHVFTKETCTQFIEQDRIYKEKLKETCLKETDIFQKAIDTMGYTQMEFTDDIMKGKVSKIIPMMKEDTYLFTKEETKAVKNYIKLHTK